MFVKPFGNRGKTEDDVQRQSYVLKGRRTEASVVRSRAAEVSFIAQSAPLTSDISMSAPQSTGAGERSDIVSGSSGDPEQLVVFPLNYVDRGTLRVAPKGLIVDY